MAGPLDDPFADIMASPASPTDGGVTGWFGGPEKEPAAPPPEERTPPPAAPFGGNPFASATPEADPYARVGSSADLKSAEDEIEQRKRELSYYMDLAALPDAKPTDPHNVKIAKQRLYASQQRLESMRQRAPMADPSAVGEGGRGLVRGLFGTVPEMLGGAAEFAAGYLPEPLREAGEYATSGVTEFGRGIRRDTAAPETAGFSSLDPSRDGLAGRTGRWAAGALGEGLGTSIPTIAGMLTPAGRAGGVGISVAMGQGQMYNSLRDAFKEYGMDATHADLAPYVLYFGSAIGALESITELAALSPVKKNAIIASIPKLIAKRLAQGGLSEGVTEVLQEALEIEGVSRATGVDSDPEKNRWRLLDSFMGGLVPGMGLSTAHSGREAIHTRALVRDLKERGFTDDQIAKMSSKDVEAALAIPAPSATPAAAPAPADPFADIMASPSPEATASPTAAPVAPASVEGPAAETPPAVTPEAPARAVDDLGFYSAALEAAKEWKQPRGTPQQAIKYLKSKGVKDAEIEATGLEAFLADKKSVTREELSSFLEQNRTQLKEHLYGSAWGDPVPAKDGSGFNLRLPDGTLAEDPNAIIGGPTVFATPEAAMDGGARMNQGRFRANSLVKEDTTNPTYVERVVHLPSKATETDVKLDKEVSRLRRQLASVVEDGRHDEADHIQSRLDQLQDRVRHQSEYLGGREGTYTDKDFRSGHFPQPNIVGHYQASVQKDSSGEDVFTLSQLQSDEGQKVRDKGIKDDAKIAKLEAQRSEFAAAVESAKDEQSATKANAELRRVQAELYDAVTGATGHPLVNTTDQWTNTTLRRAIKDAVDSGAQSIAIPSGQTVLSYNPGDEHGMQEFYDKIVPKNLSNLLRKMDPSVKPTKTATLKSHDGSKDLGKGFTVFPITDKVREAVGGGQPMFAVANASKAAMEKLAAGKPIQIPVETRNAVVDAFRPLLHMVPAGTDVGALRGIVPGKPMTFKGEQTREMHLTFVDHHGSPFRLSLPFSYLRQVRALRLPAGHTSTGGPALVFLHYGSFDGLAETVRGELWHESVHDLRRQGLIPDADWARLLDQGKSLRVLDTQIGTYLEMIHYPDAARNDGLPLLDRYEQHYKGQPGFQESIDQEYAAHLAELHAHGQLFPMETAPVQDILDKISNGTYAGTTTAAESSTGPMSALNGEGGQRGRKTPPVAPGKVRMYHGGANDDTSGGRWFTTDLKYAQGYADKSAGGKVSYVDLPDTHPAVTPEYADQGPKQGFTFAAELPESIAKNRKTFNVGESANANGEGGQRPQAERIRNLRREIAEIEKAIKEDRVPTFYNPSDEDAELTMRASMSRNDPDGVLDESFTDDAVREAKASPDGLRRASWDFIQNEQLWGRKELLASLTEKKTEGGQRPQSALSVIRGFGGIQDPKGELRSILGAPSRAGRKAQGNQKGYLVGVINNKSGMPLDRARERLVEMGYLPQDSDINAMYDMIERMARGERVVAQQDMAAEANYAQDQEADAEMDRVLHDAHTYFEELGFDYNLTEPEERRVTELVRDGMKIDDAIERAYQETIYARDESVAAPEVSRPSAPESSQAAEGQPAEASAGVTSPSPVGNGTARGEGTAVVRRQPPPLPRRQPPPIPLSPGAIDYLRSGNEGGGGRGGPPPPPGGRGPPPVPPPTPRRLTDSPRIDQEVNKSFADRMKSWVKTVNEWYAPIEAIPDVNAYRTLRNRAKGKIGDAQDMSVKIWKAFKKASDADKKASYAYLTTRDADPASIKDPSVREAAIASKQTIDWIGQALVARGMISEESYQKFRGEYLPRLYLRHIVKNGRIVDAMAGGTRPSKMPYTKERNEALDAEIRALMGEVKDPGFLASRGVLRPMRDIALIDFLNQVAGNDQWVFRDGLVDYRGKKASPYYLRSEAVELRDRAYLTQREDPVNAQKMLDEAAIMDAAASTVIGKEENVPDGYKRIPDSPRYGMLRGMLVREEIKNDILGTSEIISDEAPLTKRMMRAAQAGVGRWKGYKVAMSPTSQFRNVFGNKFLMWLAGMTPEEIRHYRQMAEVEMNGWKIRSKNLVREYSPELAVQIADAINAKTSDFSNKITGMKSPESFYNKMGMVPGDVFKHAKSLGLKASGFGEGELGKMNREFMKTEQALAWKKRGGTARVATNALLNASDIVVENTGSEAMQWFEGKSKIALMMWAMDKLGMNPDESFNEAQKWLFDYSETPETIKSIRKSPIGIPFITFQYKVLPRIIESVVASRGATLAPFIVMPYVIAAAFNALWDVGDDDVDKLRKSIAEYLRRKSSMFIIPWKDEKGRWQFFDYGYLLPWSMPQEFASAVMDKDPNEARKAVGLFGAPLAQVINAVLSGVDPFTGRAISDKSDPPAKRAADIMAYVWRLAAPPWATDQSVIKKIADSVNEKVSKNGDPPLTTSQAVMRGLGFNIYPIEPEVSRAREIRRMHGEIRDVQTRMKYAIRDKSLSAVDRARTQAEYRSHMKAKQDELRKYMKESAIPDKLRTDIRSGPKKEAPGDDPFADIMRR